MKMTDLSAEAVVDHPKHYNVGKIECIDVIEDWDLGFHLGNCLKYICRAKYTGNEIEDLKKARWYLDRFITNIDLGSRNLKTSEKSS